METEKLAVIGLVIIIVAGLSTYLILNENILDIFKEEEKEIGDDGVIGTGDCADVYFTEKYESNGTVIDTNYESVAIAAGIYNETNTYEPAQIFVDPNFEFTSPEGYENYSSWIYLPGFLEGLEGMKAGDKKTITLTPENAYGDWNESLAELYFDFLISQYGYDPISSRVIPKDITQTIPMTGFESLYSEILDISTIYEGQIFDYLNGTLQNGENTTWQIQITNISDQNVTIKDLVENETILKSEGSWDYTIIIVNETTLKIRADPEINGVYGEPGMFMKVLDFNETRLRIALNMQAPSVDRIGQNIVFELEVVKVYNTSDQLEI